MEGKGRLVRAHFLAKMFLFVISTICISLSFFYHLCLFTSLVMENPFSNSTMVSSLLILLRSKTLPLLLTHLAILPCDFYRLAKHFLLCSSLLMTQSYQKLSG